jgi:alcohol dehydrogenase
VQGGLERVVGGTDVVTGGSRSGARVLAIDLAGSRLEAAKQFGAGIAVNNGGEDPLEVIRSLTDGLGADVAIEAVGVPATFELAGGNPS